MEPTRPGSRNPTSGASLLPGQAMASIEELKVELESNSSNIPLKLSILSSLITKLQGEVKVPYLKQKLQILLQQKSLQEAEIDIQTLLSLEDCEENRLLR